MTSARTDGLIEEIARRQHGIVSRAQLLAAGVGARAIARRVERRRLRPLYRGVYAVGPVRGMFAAEMAATLACGTGAATGHRSAAAMWKQVTPGERAPVDVIVTGCARRPGPGVRVHRTRTLLPDEVTRLEGVPVTTPARTLLDLGSSSSGRDLERAVAESYVLGLSDDASLRSMIARHPRHPGAVALAAVLDAGEPAHTRSPAEEVGLALIDSAGIARPKVNVWVAGHRVDFWWPRLRLVMETDGYRSHSSKRAFERDRERDADLRAAGIDVIRFTYTHLTERPSWVLVKLGGAIALAEQRVRGR